MTQAEDDLRDQVKTRDAVIERLTKEREDLKDRYLKAIHADQERPPLTSGHYESVRKFMALAGQTIRTKPEVPTLEECHLRSRLILEEALETVEALGFIPTVCGFEVTMENVRFTSSLWGKLVDLAGIADGCADLSVVTIGTLLSCGIPDAPLFELVCENNLQKFGPGGRRDETGKWVRPPNHQPPDIAGLLKSLNP